MGARDDVHYMITPCPNAEVPTDPSPSRLLRCAGALGLLGLAAFLAHAGLGLGGVGLDSFFNNWMVNGLALGAAGSCLVRGMTGEKERTAWLLMGVGIALWTGGSLWYYLVLADLEAVPIPSVADALWVVSYPFMYMSLVLLVRSRLPGLHRSLWLDGAISALALAAVAAAVALGPIMQATTGSFAIVSTGLAYVAVDLILLILVATVFGLTFWRPGRAWLFLGLGLLLLASGDWIYLFQTAKGTYVDGGVLDAAWPAAFMLVGFAAWQPASDKAERTAPGLLPAVAPAVAAIMAVVLLAYDHFTQIPTVAMVLSSATLLLASARLFSAFRENDGLLATSREEALHDPLTGLGNRRLLMRDLETRVAEARLGSPLAVLLFDLNGFKQYNDTYGHPAGDQLLARLGWRLRQAVAPQGEAYRLGGDEFCALVPHGANGLDSIVARAATGLSEQGEGFSIDSSYGVVRVPADAANVERALALADSRMYARKGTGRASASRQSRDVLMKVLSERQPGLHTHLKDVAILATRVARRMRMTTEEVDEVGRAAELHDVGKMAIPDAILNKSGALDGNDWAFMERHTVIGERILSAAAALVPVARIVRSTHERFDGTGYPDQLSADAIPLGARIILVCDAFGAMTSNRPYSEPLPPEAALAELRRCSGTQFDPQVVTAFCAVASEARGDASPLARSFA